MGLPEAVPSVQRWMVPLAMTVMVGFGVILYGFSIYVTFVKWHAGQLTWAAATRSGRIQLHGPTSLVRAFPTWNGRSMFAHVKPRSPRARSARQAERRQNT